MTVNDEGANNDELMRTGLHVENHLHRFPPERYHRIEACEVEIIFNEVFRDLAKVFVSGQRAEPADPSQC